MARSKKNSSSSSSSVSLTLCCIIMLGCVAAAVADDNTASGTVMGIAAKSCNASGETGVETGVDGKFLYTTGPGLTAWDASSLHLEFNAEFPGYGLIPMTETTGVAFKAFGSFMQPTGVGVLQATISQPVSLSDPIKLDLPNSTLIYGGRALAPDLALITYTTQFLGYANTVSLMHTPTGKLLKTNTVALDGSSLGLNFPTLSPDKKVAYFWTGNTSYVMRMSTSTLAFERILLPAQYSPADAQIADVALNPLTGASFGYLYRDTKANHTILAEVALPSSQPSSETSPGASVPTQQGKLLAATILPPQPQNNMTLYWSGPAAVKTGFVALSNFWNQTLLFSIPFASPTSHSNHEPQPLAPAFDRPLQIPGMVDPNYPAVTFGSDLYIKFMTSLFIQGPAICPKSTFFVLRIATSDGVSSPSSPPSFQAADK